MNEQIDLALCRTLQAVTLRYEDVDSITYLNILYEAVRMYNKDYGTVYDPKEAVHIFMQWVSENTKV